jgi:hypothetical protein
MRRIALPIIAILAATLPALARDPMAKDGKFTICEFQDFDKCELLTDRTIVRYKFNTREKRTLAALKVHAAAKSVSLAALEQSFGKPSKVFPHTSRPNEKTVAWFYNSVGLNDLNAKCPECGIYVYVSSDIVTSLNYIVDDKFTVGWNRMVKP